MECLDDHGQGPHQLCPVPQCGQHSRRPEPELSPTGGGRRLSIFRAASFAEADEQDQHATIIANTT